MTLAFLRPRGSDRGAFRRVMLAAASLTAVSLPAAEVALANDLLGQLIEASKKIPATEEGRERCSQIEGLQNRLNMPFTLGDHRIFTDGTTGYHRDAVGAYLGDGPKGEPPPLFVQALLDAGAARRVTMTWIERTTLPTGVVPHLQDTGVPNKPGDDRPAFVTRQATLVGDAYLVTGGDRALFTANTNRYVPSAWPPAIGDQATDAAGRPASPPAAPPPGLWSTARVCVDEEPARVLEYGDVEVRENGVKYVSAAILFHPARLPAWASDYRVALTTRDVFVPDDVRFVTFRDDGDGWRPTPFPQAVLHAPQDEYRGRGMKPAACRRGPAGHLRARPGPSRVRQVSRRGPSAGSRQSKRAVRSSTPFALTSR